MANKQMSPEKMTTLNAKILTDVLSKEQLAQLKQMNIEIAPKSGVLSTTDIPAIGNFLQKNDLGGKYIEVLMDRVALTMLKVATVGNVFERFDRGEMGMGHTIQEIFIEMAKPHKYDSKLAETEFMKREIPEVYMKLHSLNAKYRFKQTVNEDDLYSKFTSIDRLNDFVAKVIDGMYRGLTYTEKLIMMHITGRAVLDGGITTVQVGQLIDSNLTEMFVKIKSTIAYFETETTRFNYARVLQSAPREKQIMLNSIDFTANTDVKLLANAYNLDKVSLLPERITIGKFTDMNFSLLDEVFEDDSNYRPLTEEEKIKLDNVHAIIMDEEFYLKYNRLLKMKKDENGQGLYINYNLHKHGLYSMSPFANVVAFVDFVEATPTTPDSMELLDEEGNVINIVEQGGVYKIVTTPSNLTNIRYIVKENKDNQTKINFDMLVVGWNETASTIQIIATDTKTGEELYAIARPILAMPSE